MQPPPSTKLSKIYRWRPKNRHVATLIEVELSTNLNSQLKLKTTTEEEIIRNIFNLYSVFKKSHFIFLNYTKEFPRKETSVFMGIFSLIFVVKEHEILYKSVKNHVKIRRKEFDGKIWAILANQIWHQNLSGKTKWNWLLQTNHGSSDEVKLAPVKIWRFNTKRFQGETDLWLLFTIRVENADLWKSGKSSNWTSQPRFGKSLRCRLAHHKSKSEPARSRPKSLLNPSIAQ